MGCVFNVPKKLGGLTNQNQQFQATNTQGFKPRSSATRRHPPSAHFLSLPPFLARRIFFHQKYPSINDMGVSLNGGTPKSSILMRFSIINHPFRCTPILGNTHITIIKSQFPCNCFIEECTCWWCKFTTKKQLGCLKWRYTHLWKLHT